jgi:hypothetical protein
MAEIEPLRFSLKPTLDSSTALLIFAECNTLSLFLLVISGITPLALIKRLDFVYSSCA